MHFSAECCLCLEPKGPYTFLLGTCLPRRRPPNSWGPRLSPRLNWSSSLCAGQWELGKISAEDSLIERAGRSFSRVLTHHAVMNACHLSLRALLKPPSVESGSHHTLARSRTLPSTLIAVWATTSDILHQRTVALAIAGLTTVGKKKEQKKHAGCSAANWLFWTCIGSPTQFPVLLRW